jgi:hypothetical protein
VRKASEERGCILAVVRLLAVVETPLDLPVDQRPWWMGPLGWVLGEVRGLRQPVPAMGRQGVWQLPGDVLFQVRDQFEQVKPEALR